MGRLRLPLVVAVAAAVVALLPSVSSAGTPASPAAQQVGYRGYHVTVPVSWRVVDLDRHPSACVIFDSATVYVGRAGEQQDCPAHAVGGAPGLWIRPLDPTTSPGDARILDRGAAATMTPDTSGESHLLVRAAGVLVWSFGGAESAQVLASATLSADARPAAALPAAGAGTTETTATATATATVETPGTFRGRGFDACTAPGGKVMKAWKESTNFRSVGIYIGGVSRACAQPNLTADWVRSRVAGGWHPLAIYVGLQAPCESDRFAHTMSNDPSTARSQGRGAANAAVNNAKSLAIGPNSVIYYDIEAYNNLNDTCRRAVLNFLSGWTNELHRANYRSGVYSSISSGITDLSNTYSSDSFARPNHIWAAWWNGENNIDFKPYVPDGQWDQRQRVHQYVGGHNETHGGHTLNIDSNFMSVH